MPPPSNFFFSGHCFVRRPCKRDTRGRARADPRPWRCTSSPWQAVHKNDRPSRRHRKDTAAALRPFCLFLLPPRSPVLVPLPLTFNSSSWSALVLCSSLWLLPCLRWPRRRGSSARSRASRSTCRCRLDCSARFRKCLNLSRRARQSALLSRLRVYLRLSASRREPRVAMHSALLSSTVPRPDGRLRRRQHNGPFRKNNFFYVNITTT
jgi:hypothetical protein